MRKPPGFKSADHDKSAMRLVRKLIEADAVDLIDIARIEQRFPNEPFHHPGESTEVAIEAVFDRNVSASEHPAERINRLRNVLGASGIFARSSGALPIKIPPAGTVRLFRAETDRRNRDGHYEGARRTVKSRGNYFTTSPVVAARYATPQFSPKGAPLLYVDVPRAVADASRSTKPSVVALLRNGGQRMPRRHRHGEVSDVEYYLDDEWAGRAITTPTVIEANNAIVDSGVFDSSRWVFGRELLVSNEDSPLRTHIALQYVGGDAVACDGPNIDRDWTGETRCNHRHYVSAEIAVPLDHDAVMFIRSGVDAHNSDFLMTLIGEDASRLDDRLDFGVIELALSNIDHLITGDAAALLQGHPAIARDLNIVDIVIPRSEVPRLAQLIAGSDLAPPNAAEVVWCDAASVLRKLLVASEPMPLRSPTLGNLNVSVVTNGEFARLGSDTVGTTFSSTNRDGNTETVPLQMTRSSNAASKTARRVRGRRTSKES